MSTPVPLAAGALVADRYHLDETLAGEGSAAILRATDTRVQRTVALRVVPAATAEERERSTRQGKAAARLTHPNLARVLDFGIDDGSGAAYAAAELGAGGTLAALLAQRGTPPFSLALRIVQEMAAGMAAAHAGGATHGELHPGMLWLSRDEGKMRVQVLGLGVDGAGTLPSRATARYASPERLRRARDLSPRSDVFSLGVMALEMLAGLPADWNALLVAMVKGQPVQLPSPLAQQPALGPELADAIVRALAPAPGDRWEAAGAFAAALAVAVPPSEAPPGRIPLAVTIARAPAEPVADAPLAEAAPPVVEVAALVADPVPDTAPPPVVASVPAEAPPVPATPTSTAPVAAAPSPAADAAPVEAASVKADLPVSPIATPAVRPAPRKPAAHKVTLASTDLADSLYIPPALNERAAPPVIAAAPSPVTPPVAPAPAVPVAAAPIAPPTPVPAAAPEPAVAPRVDAVPAAEVQHEVDVQPAVDPQPVIEAMSAFDTMAVETARAIARTESTAPVHAPEPRSFELSAVAPVAETADVISPPPSTRRARIPGGRRGMIAAGVLVVLMAGGGIVAVTKIGGAAPGAAATQRLASTALRSSSPDGAPSASPVAAKGMDSAISTPSAPSAQTAGAVDAASAAAAERLRKEEQRREEERRNEQQRRADSTRAAQLALAAAPSAPPPAAAPAPVVQAERPQISATPSVSAPRPQVAAPVRRADPSRIYSGGEVDRAPSLANRADFARAVARSYPSALQDSRVAGGASVEFVVLPDGRVDRSSVRVLGASHPAFQNAAVSAIMAARFTPAQVDGVAVKAQVSMPLTWNP